jgi:hypothetical protein
MAVLVKPNGLPGTCYMAVIRPFRRLIVYPLLTRETGRAWRTLDANPHTGAHAPQIAGARPSPLPAAAGLRFPSVRQDRRYGDGADE